MKRKEAINYSKLYIEISVETLEINALEIIEQTGEHTISKAELFLVNESEFSVMNNITKATNVKIVLKEDDELNVIFIGMVMNFKLEKIKDTYKIDLELKSKTIEMDFKKKRRSFQDENNPYSNLFKKIIEEDNGGKSSLKASLGRMQKESIIQYDETDWEFVKRLASKLKAVLIINSRSEFPNIRIGVSDGNTFEETTETFYLTNQAEEYFKSHLNFGDWMSEEKSFFRYESINDYQLSDTIIFDEQRLKIFKKITKLEKGIITFEYCLLKEKGFRQDLIVNPKILGVSINGKILKIDRDRVKIHLEIDESQDVSKAYWYKWETAYTTEGSTGFYSMPQEGDEVKLYIPKTEIEDGYVRIVNRSDGEYNLKTQDPKVKYYGTIDKKELMLAPDEFQITTTNELILINMHEEKGVEITSSGYINIQTQAETKIESKKKIGIRAGEYILLATAGSSIKIDKNINISCLGTLIR